MPKDNKTSKLSKKINGFTLIELMVAIMIFAIISVISYRTISSLVATKQVVTVAQDKWGALARAVNSMSTYWDRVIPLTVRDENGMLIPAVIGKNKLSGNSDSQLEFTISGFVGDEVYGSTPPRRIGFRYLNGNLYIVTWMYMNRVPNTKPQIELILNNVSSFTVEFLYPDNQWHDTWPADNNSFANIPGLKMRIKLTSGEEVERKWAQ